MLPLPPLSYSSLIQLAPLFAVEGVALFDASYELIKFQAKLSPINSH